MFSVPNQLDNVFKYLYNFHLAKYSLYEWTKSTLCELKESHMPSHSPVGHQVPAFPSLKYSNMQQKTT